MKYKLIACDLDGTLLDNRNQISRENLAAIDEIIRCGGIFVPASGRTLSEIPAELTGNPRIRYLIYANGAVVLDRETGWKFTTGMSAEDKALILSLARACESHITLRVDGRCYVDAARQSEEWFDYYHVFEAHRHVVRAYADPVKDFTALCDAAEDVEVVSLFFHRTEDKTACRKRLEETGHLRVAEIGSCLEIMNIRAGKGNALLALAGHIGLMPSELIGVGDSGNDISMIRAAGLGLATSNAAESLKTEADRVICSNEEHAIDFIYRHYFAKG